MSDKTSMTEKLENKPPSNKLLYIFLTVGGVVLAGILITLIVFFFTAPKTTNDTTPDNGTEKLAQETVPEVTDFTVTQTDGTYVATFTVPNAENTKTGVEYKIENNKTRILAEGKTKAGDAVEEPITPSQNDTSITLSLRTTNGILNSDWVAQDTYELEGSVQTPQFEGLNEEYYQSSWALQEENSVEALNKAVEIAYDAQYYNPEEQVYCAVGGDSEVKLGEIIPPTPETLDDSYFLRFETTAINDDTYHLYYYWCYTE